MAAEVPWYRRQANEFYTMGEEVANGITHGLGALLSLVGLVVLLIVASRYGTIWHVISFAIFGASLTLLYFASTLYHIIQNRAARRVLRILDHSAIFLLIAGTYTPFLLVAIRGVLGWSYMGIVWGIAIAGVIYKIFFLGKFEVLSTIAYVLMGWMLLLAYRQMLAAVPPSGIFWLAAGGAFYTVGVLFYALNKLPYNHAIWHLFVLGGSFCHFFAVWSLVG